VGLLGLGVNSFVLFLIHGLASLSLLLAAPIAFEIAVVHNYLWNDYWTFGTRSPSIKKLVKFNLVSVGALSISIGALYALVEWAGWHYLMANLAAIGVGFTWNFSLNVVWTWRGGQSRIRGQVLNAAGR
jgi:dolichol-phosphate mannosyltransferase